MPEDYYFSSARNDAGLDNDLEVLILDFFLMMVVCTECNSALSGHRCWSICFTYNNYTQRVNKDNNIAMLKLAHCYRNVEEWGFKTSILS